MLACEMGGMVFFSQVLPYIGVSSGIVLMQSLVYSLRRVESAIRVMRIAAALLTVIALSILPGLRSDAVGSDTWMYRGFYERWIFTDSFEITLNQSVIEPGFALWMYFLKVSGFSSQGFFLITALVTNGLIVLAIIKSAKNVEMALSLYSISGAYLFSFNGMRQAMAIAVVAFGVALFLKGRRFGLILVASAVAIHLTAVGALIGLLLVSSWMKRLSSLSIQLVAAVGLLVLVISSTRLRSWLDALDSNYGDYLTVNSGTGLGRVAALLLVFGTLILLRNDRTNSPDCRMARYFSLAFGIQIIGLELSVFDREALYFSVFMPILLSNTTDRVRHSRPLLIGGMLIYYLMYLIRYGQLIPYVASFAL